MAVPRNSSAPILNVPITTAVSAVTTGSASLMLPAGIVSVGVQFNFTYGSGGTTAKFWLQTTFDNGATWVDIANLAATTASLRRLYNLDNTAVTSIATPSDGALSDNTCVNGLLGDRLRVKYTTTGTYAGSTTIAVHAVLRGS